MSFSNLLKFEVKKFFKEKTALAGLLLVVAVCVVFSLMNFISRPADAYGGVQMIMDSIYIQNTVLFIIPFVAILLAVHSTSEEFSTGTMRTLMTRPVKRENIVASKVLVLLLYLCIVSFTVMVISFLFGLKWGYPEGSASIMPRVVLIYLEYVLGAMVLAAFTFFVASRGVKPVVTAVTSLGFFMVFVLLERFPPVQNYTFSYHVSSSIQLFMAETINTRMALQSTAAVLIYILAFLLLASTLWERRDIAV